MATITKIKGAKGIMYRAQIRKKSKGAIVYSEARTFSKRALAERWAAKREDELAQPGAIEHAKRGGMTLGALLKAYEEKYCAKAGRSKKADIKRLQGYELASVPLSKLTAEAMIDHIRWRTRTAKPQTANNDLVWIDTVCKAAYAAFGVKVNLSEIEAAKVFCRQHGMIRKAEERSRRPTEDELSRLSAHFASRDGRASIPMSDIMWFAVHSTRREAEITRLRWDDNNAEHKTGMVRDLKHPRKKEGNHKRFKYTAEAWEIVERQPRPKGAEFIFPYEPRSISAAFTRACHLLEIKDLRFHDLRHEGTSRLFEKGYSIPEVQLFTLHESWAVLRRYTNLRPESVALR